MDDIRKGLILHTDKAAFLKSTRELFGVENVAKFISMIVKTLKTKKSNRTNEDLKKLVPLIKDIPFFRDRHIEGPMMLDVVGCMGYKRVRKDEYLFEYGDVGDNFYLILDG